MYPTRVLRQAVEAAEHHRTPLIHFLGKRTPPSQLSPPFHTSPRPLTTLSPKEAVDSAPHVHPASPSETLPESFAQYRSKAQQHGPLGGHRSPPPPPSPSLAYGAVGGHSGHELGSVKPPKGQYFDRSELPARFRRMTWTEAEIEAVETGGASAVT